jgi:hypothetical protein
MVVTTVKLFFSFEKGERWALTLSFLKRGAGGSERFLAESWSQNAKHFHGDDNHDMDFGEGRIRVVTVVRSSSSSRSRSEQ